MDLFARLQGMKVLLVEDEPLIRDSLQRFFANENCPFIAVETGEDALEVIKDTDCDIIITDYRLPGMDGLEFLKRAQRLNVQFKKILLTAYMTEAVISEAFRIGVHEFIEKPFAMEDLEEALIRVLEKKIISNGPPLAKKNLDPRGD
ncbi:response regulator [Thiovibrio frasassiensis]|uniref:Response regulator n=1 Tax=Thiovibrio frasassiensis TaxID=2984131 RepID=A0A9X4MH65_9BACT|nr:response regulator [Thiovibrio frasassiensis]MDG4476160.1 response regulator [Thiovibrio frasassiensis]